MENVYKIYPLSQNSANLRKAIKYHERALKLLHIQLEAAIEDQRERKRLLREAEKLRQRESGNADD